MRQMRTLEPAIDAATNENDFSGEWYLINANSLGLYVTCIPFISSSSLERKMERERERERGRKREKTPDSIEIVCLLDTHLHISVVFHFSLRLN